MLNKGSLIKEKLLKNGLDKMGNGKFLSPELIAMSEQLINRIPSINKTIKFQ